MTNNDKISKYWVAINALQKVNNFDHDSIILNCAVDLIEKYNKLLEKAEADKPTE